MNKTKEELKEMIREFFGLKPHKLIHLNHVLNFFIQNVSQKSLHYEEIINRWDLNETRLDKQPKMLFEYIIQEYKKEQKYVTEEKIG